MCEKEALPSLALMGGENGNLLGRFGVEADHCDFCSVMSVRIVTINQGEEAMIRVNSGKPITLEFPGHLVTVYEMDGVIFQRVEKQWEGEGEIAVEREALSDDVTEIMDKEEGEGFTEIDEEEETRTEIDETPPWTTPDSMKDAINKAINYLARVEPEDIKMIRKNLFG